MTTSVTAPPPCSPRSTCWRARSSGSACRATVTRSSSRSCAGSTGSSRLQWPCTWILDNYGTHTHPKVRRWLARRPRFHLHFTPTSASWLNLVERWFRELTEKQLRRGVFRSVPDLVAAIEGFVAAYNADPKPFVWTASVESILAKVNRCKAILETHH